jgi:hypothetical protein
MANYRGLNIVVLMARPSDGSAGPTRKSLGLYREAAPSDKWIAQTCVPPFVAFFARNGEATTAAASHSIIPTPRLQYTNGNETNPSPGFPLTSSQTETILFCKERFLENLISFG